jgi:hypothetical protein
VVRKEAARLQNANGLLFSRSAAHISVVFIQYTMVWLEHVTKYTFHLEFQGKRGSVHELTIVLHSEEDCGFWQFCSIALFINIAIEIFSMKLHANLNLWI